MVLPLVTLCSYPFVVWLEFPNWQAPAFEPNLPYYGVLRTANKSISSFRAGAEIHVELVISCIESQIPRSRFTLIGPSFPCLQQAISRSPPTHSIPGSLCTS